MSGRLRGRDTVPSAQPAVQQGNGSLDATGREAAPRYAETMATTERRESSALTPAPITSSQPGGGFCMSLELAWGRCAAPGCVAAVPATSAAGRQAPGPLPGLPSRRHRLSRSETLPQRLRLLVSRGGRPFPVAGPAAVGPCRSGRTALLQHRFCPGTDAGHRAGVTGSAVVVGAGLRLVAAAWLFVVSFFRDPERVLPTDPLAVLSPADGTITHVGEVQEEDFVGGRAFRIGIFLSVFNVHVNRIPRSGRVLGAALLPRPLPRRPPCRLRRAQRATVDRPRRRSAGASGARQADRRCHCPPHRLLAAAGRDGPGRRAPGHDQVRLAHRTVSAGRRRQGGSGQGRRQGEGRQQHPAAREGVRVKSRQRKCKQVPGDSDVRPPSGCRGKVVFSAFLRRRDKRTFAAAFGTGFSLGRGVRRGGLPSLSRWFRTAFSPRPARYSSRAFLLRGRRLATTRAAAPAGEGSWSTAG